MQKNLIIFLLILVTVSINIAVTNFLIDRKITSSTIPKIVVIDKKELLAELSGKADKVQTIRDYNNLMTFLRTSGYVAVNKQHVLTNGTQYDMPKINMLLIEAMLMKQGVALMSESEAKTKLDKASNLIKNDFNF